MSVRKDAKKQVRKAARATEFDPMKVVSNWGIRSGHANTAGLISAVLSMITWWGSRGKSDDNAKAGGWGLYFGTCAATLFALGVGLKEEEKLL